MKTRPARWLLLGLVYVFLLGELALRVVRKEYSLKSNLKEHIDVLRAAYPVQHDPELGWVPRAVVWERANLWGTKVTILEHGIRSNGEGALPPEVPDAPPLLAVGDSFTFGDQVSDEDTWPACLERLLGRRVINGGVFGYGIDQIYLRARQLVDVLRPGLLIFSFIAEDIGRCEMSEYSGAPKPHFEVRDGRLELRNVPAPPPSPQRIGGPRRYSSYSLLVHEAMLRLFPKYWLQGARSEQRVHGRGEEVACLILKDLAELGRTKGVPTYVLVQYSPITPPRDYEVLDRLTGCARSAGLQVVDLRPALEALMTNDKMLYATLYFDHMTAAGNRFVATVLRDALARAGQAGREETLP